MVSTHMNVVLVGANGKLGPTMLQHLITHPNITPTVLSRESSSSVYPADVEVARVPDDFPHDSLVAAFRGQTAVIVTVAGSKSDVQIKLADAAAEAGVRTFIPADFGSCDSSSPFAVSTVPVFAAKQKVRRHLEALAAAGKLAWTSLVCGHFFDYGLNHGLLHISVQDKSALVFDGGDIKWSATTMDSIAKATTKVLEMELQTRNQMLYIQSFRVSQNEVLDAIEKITGNRFKRQTVDSVRYIEELKKLHLAHPDDDKVFHDLCGVIGLIDADWEKKDGFAARLLGLEEENLDQVLRQLLEDE